ncbi:MAG: C4-dicarboxylate ABC transporter permease [Parvibaculum sp.]|jgi:TRAP-type mannitol/chloroaromatic compound transport system permease small subunit|uniref:TRAP transporter small permease subunit n=1 Tax=Parvibaculum sp. TaxID=2024848 RepID=UPI000C58773F|nr:TRAP transporter small permease subunit [Parvibaculum sp.]MAU59104.1 C4-dicarboxylate ABC transporter permease [Parvibaculum sp.]MAV92331.1 C4-dicarboxylate ABC transporter permease [Pseudobdellovibrionaceae bacterium]|tara:strand:+ start:314 stop:853 length:540 start_codon:yes stop_codon:yes gene_type:complete
MEALSRIARLIDAFNERVGRAFSWLALLMVLVQFVVVLQRYVFGVGSIWAQESIVYMHGLMFMIVAGYTLLHNAHVRVDVFYRIMPPARKALVDLLGTLFLLWPVCFLIFYVSLPYVEASWAVREGSRETSGIQGVYLLKSVILVFAVLLALQGLSTIIHALRILSGAEKPVEEASPIL